jgi:hypothetical protein
LLDNPLAGGMRGGPEVQDRAVAVFDGQRSNTTRETSGSAQ